MENGNERISSFFRFEDLRIYHKSLEYIEWVNKTVSFFSEDARLTIALPFSKSAQAIALNIAEGSARNKSQFVYYLKMAKSSVRECVVFTAMAKHHNLISEIAEEESRNHLMELTKMIGALIASLQKSSGMSGSRRDDRDED